MSVTNNKLEGRIAALFGGCDGWLWSWRPWILLNLVFYVSLQQWHQGKRSANNTKKCQWFEDASSARAQCCHGDSLWVTPGSPPSPQLILGEDYVTLVLKDQRGGCWRTLMAAAPDFISLFLRSQGCARRCPGAGGHMGHCPASCTTSPWQEICSICLWGALGVVSAVVKECSLVWGGITTPPGSQALLEPSWARSGSRLCCWVSFYRWKY